MSFHRWTLGNCYHNSTETENNILRIGVEWQRIQTSQSSSQQREETGGIAVSVFKTNYMSRQPMILGTHLQRDHRLTKGTENSETAPRIFSRVLNISEGASLEEENLFS